MRSGRRRGGEIRPEISRVIRCHWHANEDGSLCRSPFIGQTVIPKGMLYKCIQLHGLTASTDPLLRLLLHLQLRRLLRHDAGSTRRQTAPSLPRRHGLVELVAGPYWASARSRHWTGVCNGFHRLHVCHPPRPSGVRAPPTRQPTGCAVGCICGDDAAAGADPAGACKRCASHTSADVIPGGWGYGSTGCAISRLRG